MTVPPRQAVRAAILKAEVTSRGLLGLIVYNRGVCLYAITEEALLSFLSDI